MDGAFYFSPIKPGTYDLNLSGAPAVYLPPTVVKVVGGNSLLRLFVYALETFRLSETQGLSINGTQPGPPIQVNNGTAVRIIMYNNSTLVHDFSVVQDLGNTDYSNVIFDSLSATVTSGGVVTDTFVVNKIGLFYYKCLIGSHSAAGEWGAFEVFG